jgi:demethylmenaquinone methyltransferase / 2-methoxy-6-polyprenyl-1,4-benzoquinol methylase
MSRHAEERSRRLRPPALRAAAAPLRPARRAALLRPERALATGDGRAHRRRRARERPRRRHRHRREGAERVRRRGRAPRIRLLVGRAERLPFADASFDALAFTYLLRYVADPAATLRELARVVRPGGTVASLEFMLPANPVWRRCWWLYTRLVLPAAGALFGRGWFDVGRFLGPSISTHYRRHPLEWHRRAWEAAGIEEVGVRTMSLGGGLVMWGRRAG